MHLLKDAAGHLVFLAIDVMTARSAQAENLSFYGSPGVIDMPTAGSLYDRSFDLHYQSSPAPDGIVVQVEKFCDPSAAFLVVEQQDRICPPGNLGPRAGDARKPQARSGLLGKESRGGSWA